MWIFLSKIWHHGSYFSNKNFTALHFQKKKYMCLRHLLALNWQQNSSFSLIANSYWILWWRLRWLYRLVMLLCGSTTMLKHCLHRMSTCCWWSGLHSTKGSTHWIVLLFLSTTSPELCFSLLWRCWIMCILHVRSTRGENVYVDKTACKVMKSLLVQFIVQLCFVYKYNAS